MRHIESNHTRRSLRQRGASLFMISVTVSILATLSVSMVVATNSISKEKLAERQKVSALFAAEAGIAEAVFSLNNEGTGAVGLASSPKTVNGSSYWVEVADLPGGEKTLTATGVQNRAGVRLELTVEKDNQSIWTWGAFGDEGLTMDSNSHVDSYDSALGDYSSQQVNGSGNGAYANEKGHVGSNGDISLLQNSEVHGSAIPGPTSTTTVSGNASVSGSTVPNSGVINLPELVMPNFGSSGNFETGTGYTGTLASGDYGFGNFELGKNSTLTVFGPARIVVSNFELLSNSTMTIDATNGPVEIYVWRDFIMNSNTSLASTTMTPADISLNLNSDNVVNPTQNVQLAEVAFESNSTLCAMMFAPNASVDIDSNFELFGAVVARQLHLDSWSRIHYDEALQNVGVSGVTSKWKAVAWRKLGYKQPANASYP